MKITIRKLAVHQQFEHAPNIDIMYSWRANDFSKHFFFWKFSLIIIDPCRSYKRTWTPLRDYFGQKFRHLTYPYVSSTSVGATLVLCLWDASCASIYIKVMCILKKLYTFLHRMAKKWYSCKKPLRIQEDKSVQKITISFCRNLSSDILVNIWEVYITHRWPHKTPSLVLYVYIVCNLVVNLSRRADIIKN